MKAKVEQGMPCLAIKIMRADRVSPTEASGTGPVLQGQISSWKIRVSNMGTAPACSITLKTNVPWINIAEKTGGVATNEGRATSHCVGPSGTLMALPIKGGKEEGLINPGETVDIPILTRLSGSGKQEFYMLYRYELWDPNLTAKRSRWLRKMMDVPVYPSLTLSASLMPSFWKKAEHILSVEVSFHAGVCGLPF